MGKKSLALAAGCAAILFVTAAAFSAETSLEGDWWVSIRGEGGNKGAAMLRFDNLSGGFFDVTGDGMTLGIGRFFAVSAGQTLQRDSQGEISGTLQIEDLTGGPLGTIVITSGRVSNQFTRLKLRGTVTVPPAAAASIRMLGVRFPESLPVLTGRDEDTSLRGQSVRSRFYDLTISEDGVLGFPAFIVEGTGPARVDGVENDSVTMDGRIIRAPKGHKVYGRVSSAALGDGLVTGTLRETRKGVPRVRLRVSDTRKYRIHANLKEAVDPIVSVNPVEIDFGEITVGDEAQNAFTVKNIGTGTLTGEAEIEVSGRGFFLVSGSPYSLGEDEEATVTIRFAPPATGSFQTNVIFSGGGGATRLVKGKGVGDGGS